MATLRSAPATAGRGPALRAIALALLLSLGASGFVLATGAAPGATPSAHHPTGPVLPALSGGPRAAPAPPGCSGTYSAWQSLYGGGPAPPAVAGYANGVCLLGPDEEGVTLGSNASPSGSQLAISVKLPSVASNPLSALSEFWISVPVRGVGCSLGGISYLRIDLLPPGDPLGSPSDWAVRAPIWDLVPAGACDPRCENSSAFYSVEGSSFCLDNAVVRGIGAPGATGLPIFAPGDSVHFTIVGGGGLGMSVFANDSSRPLLSTSWSYPSGSLVNGAAAEPVGTVALASSGWGFSNGPGFGWTNCPTANLSGAPTCDSYDASGSSGLAFPSVTSADFFNVSASGYTNGYTTYAPWSSSGACSGAPGLVPCVDFVSNGGTSNYPSIHLSASGGSAWVGAGANASGLVGPIDPAGFSPNGSATPVDPALLTDLNATSNGTAISIRARATDPRGISLVAFSAVFCFSGGSSTTANALTSNGTLVAGSGGAEDAVWSAVFPRGNNLTGGTLYYSVTETDPAGEATLPTFANASIPSFGLMCTSMSAPTPAIGQTTARAVGYEVGWNYPVASQAYVVGYTITATPPAGPPSTVPVLDPSARSATIGGLLALTRYSISIGTIQVNGQSGIPSPPVPQFPTLNPFSVGLSSPSGPGPILLSQPNANATFDALASGGASPYAYEFEFGNGSSVQVGGQSAGTTLTRAFLGYLGSAPVTVVATDVAGDVATSAALWVSVSATPLGVSVALATGDDYVSLHWSAPVPGASMVTGYTVYYSQAPGAATRLTSSWPSNGSGAAPVYLRNTTSTWFNFSAPEGVEVTAEVIAWNSWGPGLAPVGGPVSGRPVTFTLTGFGPAPGSAYGGPAPFSATISASTSGGIANPLKNATYTVSELSPVANGFTFTQDAGVVNVENSTGTSGFANATLYLPLTGTFLVEVHLGDALQDSELIPSLELYVGTGSAPSASISVGTPVPFAGRPVSFQATATGTSGPYNYTWQFGDGVSEFDSHASVNHTFAAGGEYSVGLTVTDNLTGGSVTVSESIAIATVPVVRIVSAEGNSGALSYTFEAIEVGGSGSPLVAWQFGDGSQGNGEVANHTFSSAGQYTVKVLLTDPAGPTASSNLTIYAGVPPPSSTPVASATYLGAILLLVIGVVVLAALTLLYYRRDRARAREPVRPARPVYPEVVTPSAPAELEAPPPELEGPSEPPAEP